MLRVQGLSDRRRARALAADCEAFLTGHLADRLEEAGQRVPPWAWMNLVAHGSRHDLHAERAAHLPADLPAGRWHGMRSLLAAEVLGMADRCSSLIELQHEVLVPLELELAARAEVASWRPNQLALAVEHALDDRRRLRRRALAAPANPSVRFSRDDGALGSRAGLRSMPGRSFAGRDPHSSGVGRGARQIKRET